MNVGVKLFIVAVVSAACAYGIAVKVMSPKVRQPVAHFWGLPIPGTGVDAVTAGFGGCKLNDKGNSYDCSLDRALVSGKAVFGVPAGAVRLTLSLPKSEASRALPAELTQWQLTELGYSQISVDLLIPYTCDGMLGPDNARMLEEERQGTLGKLRQGEVFDCWNGRQDVDMVRRNLAAKGWVATTSVYSDVSRLIAVGIGATQASLSGKRPSMQLWNSSMDPLEFMTFFNGSVIIDVVSIEDSKLTIQKATLKGEL